VYVTNSSEMPVRGIVSKNGDALAVRTANGEIDIPLAKVVALRSAEAQQAYERSLRPGILEDWKGNFGFGFALARGNSQTTNLNTSVQFDRKTRNDHTSLYESSVYSTNSVTNSVTANAILGGARYDRNFGKELFGFVSSDFTHDELQGLDLRSIYGGGLGWHAIDTPKTTLNLLSGLNYTRESYSNISATTAALSVQRNLAAATLGDDFTHNFGAVTSLAEHFYFYPDTSKPGEYRFTLNANSNTRLTGWLSWQVRVNDLYVSNPPIAGTKSNDIIASTGLAVTFNH
jgi:putative salt-induced outer membrane protein